MILNVEAFAQKDTSKVPRILLLLDGSSSMVQSWNKEVRRYDEAKKFIIRLMDSMYQVNPRVEFSLRVFGHQYSVPEKNCFDTKQEVRFSGHNIEQMKLRLNDIQPYGVSPIAFSLEEAATYDLTDLNKYYYSLILITDGGESCDGDICNVVTRLLNKKIFFRPYIVSLINYAPLHQQYACLGNLLIAADAKGERTAIDTLVDAHARIFQAVKKDPSILKPNTEPKNLPAAVPQAVPAKAQVLASLSGQRAYQLFIVENKPPQRISSRKWNGSLPLVVIAEEVTPPPITPTIKSLVISRKYPPLKVNAKAPPSMLQRKNYPISYPLIASRDIPEEKRITGPLMQTVVSRRRIYPIPTIYGTLNPKRSQFRVNYPLITSGDFPEEKVASNPPPPPPPPPPPHDPNKVILPTESKVEAAKISTLGKPPVKPKPRVEQIKDAPFLKETEESDKTLLYIYFSDGKGKYYHTEPQISITDAETGEQVKKFYRIVDRATGSPAPQHIPPGTYNLMVEGRANTYVRRLKVEEGKKTKLNIIVGRGSLKFEFSTNPTKPMSEYTAIVNRRFAPDPDVKQNAADILNYEPGTYYAEVNTYPVHKAAFDIGFDEQIVISIPEPGQVYFTNTAPVGKVALYMPLGDAFVQFGQVIVNGNPEEQVLKMQPGYYEARFKKNPNVPFEQDVIVKFKVESNKITQILLPK